MKNLDGLSKSIISALYFEGNKSIAELSKELKLRSHKVRYSISRLLAKNIIYPHLYINPVATGYQEYQVYLKFHKNAKLQRERFQTLLMESPLVPFMCTVGGPNELGILVCAEHVGELTRLFDVLSKELKNVEYTKTVSIETAMTIYSPKFQGNSALPTKSVGWSVTDKPQKLDSMDHKIIMGLLKYGWNNSTSLARKLEIPHTTLQYRLKTLQERNVIMSFGYMLSSKAANLVPYSFLIQMTKSSQELRKSMHSYCYNHPNVSYLTECIGAWDYEIGARFSNNSDVYDFTDDLTNTFGESLGTITTVPIFKVLKLHRSFQ